MSRIWQINVILINSIVITLTTPLWSPLDKGRLAGEKYL